MVAISNNFKTKQIWICANFYGVIKFGNVAMFCQQGKVMLNWDLISIWVVGIENLKSKNAFRNRNKLNY